MAKRRVPVVDDADVEQFLALVLKPDVTRTMPDGEFIEAAHAAALAYAYAQTPTWRNEFARRVKKRLEWRLGAEPH